MKFHYLLISLVIIIFILLSHSGFRLRKNNNPLFPYYLIFSLLLIFGNIYTNAPQYALFKTFLFTSVLFPFMLTSHFDFDMKRYLILFSILLLGLFYLKFGNPLNLASSSDVFFRLNSEDNNPIIISRGLSLALIIFFFSFRNSSSIFEKIFKAFIILNLLIFIYITGSRGPVLSLIIALFFYLFYNIQNGTLGVRKFLIIAVPALLIISYFISKFSFLFQNRLFDKVSAYDSMDVRLEPQVFLITDFLEQNMFNILFGTGTGNFGYAYTGRDFSEYPHNIFLEIIYENGIFSLIIFLCVLFVLFYHFFKGNIIKKNIYFFVISIFFLVNAQFSGDLSSNVFFFVFAYFSTSNLSCRFLNQV